MPKPDTSTQPVTPERLMQLGWAYAMPLMIEAALKNGVFDALDDGAMSIPQLSRKTGASPRGLRGVLNALASVNLLTREDDRYSLAPESAAFLVSSKPGFRGGFFRHLSTQIMPNWMQLTKIVKTGKPAAAVNRKKKGAEFFEDFVEDIFPMSYGAAQAVGDALELGRAGKAVNVLDIAAGSGVWGIALAQKSPNVKVTAVDWPQVIPVTRRVARRMGVESQFRYIEGDINSINLGKGYQIATLGHILHSEGEARSRKLLKRVYSALASGGTIVIGEFVPKDDRSGTPDALIFAVNMLVNTDEGDTFTFPEIRSWLHAVGFSDVRQMEAPAPSPLILATKQK